MRFQFILEHAARWPIAIQCRALQVSRQGYYQWLHQTPSQRTQKQHQLVCQIKRIHALPRHDDYGSPRMTKALNASGTKCHENTVARLMKLSGIRAHRAKKFRVRTTQSNHDLPIAANRLNQEFTCSSINRVWLTSNMPTLTEPLPSSKYWFEFVACLSADAHN